LDTTDIHVGGF